MKPEELGKMAPHHNIVIIDGEDPIYDETYDLVRHPNYKFTHDYAGDIGANDAHNYDRTLHAKRMEEELRLLKLKTQTPQKPSAIPNVCKMSVEEMISSLAGGEATGLNHMPRTEDDYSQMFETAAGFDMSGRFQSNPMNNLVGASESAAF